NSNLGARSVLHAECAKNLQIQFSQRRSPGPPSLAEPSLDKHSVGPIFTYFSRLSRLTPHGRSLQFLLRSTKQEDSCSPTPAAAPLRPPAVVPCSNTSRHWSCRRAIGSTRWRRSRRR